jgi:hypothetical protein
MTKYLILLAFGAVTTCRLSAQDANKLLKQHYKAVGQKALSAMQTMSSTGTMTVMNATVPISCDYKRPNKYRNITKVFGLVVTTVFDGVHGYKSLPGTPTSDVTGADLDKLAQSATMDGALYLAEQQGSKFSYVGKDTAIHADKLLIISTKGDSSYAYLDSSTHYLVQVQNLHNVEGYTQVTEVHFSDFRTVKDGVVLPFETTIFDNGRVTHYFWSSIVLDGGVADDVFNKP